MRSVYTCGFLYATLLGIAILLLGCGSTAETPTHPIETSQDVADTPEPPKPQQLTVSVSADKTGPISPGDVVHLTATVEAVRGSQLKFNWINVTGYGELSDTTSNNVTWKAPTDVESGQVKVEVIQLVVTVISHIISVDETGVKTDTQILTETRTLPLTTVGI